ncbi:MAG TPA: peptidoglycan DD-metalloendopeptidase family protein [Anaerolineales bacterium]|nr:peptidoglycan DD-metalloendopeptidase family protein [Anaerolineales bacterium]
MESPQNEQNKPSRMWMILRWIPLGMMLASLLTIAGMMLAGGMVKISGWYLLQLIPPVLGVLTLIVIVIYAIVKKRMSRAWVGTLVVSILSLLPLATWFAPIPFPASIEKMTPSATIRVPADEPMLVAWGGDSIETNYHVVTPDQRWAYDLLMEPAFSGSPNLEDYGCFGVPVLAPIDGTVVSAHDGEPDETPGVVSNNIVAPAGNHVMIRIEETGTYLVIAHLKNGSVIVETGDVVKEGQQIGECGNSGNTSEPHIHIHHQRQDPTVYPLNFAEGLPLYFRDHDGDPMPVGGFIIEGESVTPLGDVIQHIGQ